jgi:hypothetical protein
VKVRCPRVKNISVKGLVRRKDLRLVMKKRALPTTRASQAASMSSTLPVALIAGAAVLAALVMRHYSSMNATDARGKTVPKDVSRRTIAGASTDRLLQLACIMALSIPYVWCVRTQTEPTVRAQLTGWWQSMPTFTSGYWLERGFAVGALGLLIERLCYTWVHVRTRHFVLFCETPLGRWMGATPPDVVYYMFCINKWIQSFTFPVWYFYTLGDAWPSTIGKPSPSQRHLHHFHATRAMLLTTSSRCI